jgi:hypothetical protein
VASQAYQRAEVKMNQRKTGHCEHELPVVESSRRNFGFEGGDLGPDSPSRQETTESLKFAHNEASASKISQEFDEKSRAQPQSRSGLDRRKNSLLNKRKDPKSEPEESRRFSTEIKKKSLAEKSNASTQRRQEFESQIFTESIKVAAHIAVGHFIQDEEPDLPSENPMPTSTWIANDASKPPAQMDSEQPRNRASMPTQSTLQVLFCAQCPDLFFA